MECKQEESKTGPCVTHFCFLHHLVAWLPLPPSERAAPGAGPCPFSSPVKVDALSLHLSSLAPVPEADIPAVEQELRAAEAALEILVDLTILAQVFQVLSLLLERRNQLVSQKNVWAGFFFSCFLAFAAVLLIKGQPVAYSLS